VSETTVVNIKTGAEYDVLIDRTTIFGNPFSQWKWGREECIRKFEGYFYDRLEHDAVWRAKVLELSGKVLGCHCLPLSCHGQIYCDYLNSYTEIVKLRLEASNSVNSTEEED